MTRQTEEDTARIRATLVTPRGGETLESEREERIARETRAATRRDEMTRMLRDKAAARAKARAKLRQIRAEIVRARADAETQTRIVREIEDERMAALTRSTEEDAARARADGVGRARAE